jgi:MATE family, multidrug efflux pump
MGLPETETPRMGLWRGEGGARELLKIAFPLILSNSVWTLQILIDRLLLSQHSIGEGTAAMPAVCLFWTPFFLLQTTAAYATTFVAQYTGAARPYRVGPAVWQGIHLSVIAGVAFLLAVPFAPQIVAIGDHTPALQELEAVYFQCLCFSALPSLITAAASGFFAGRGETWTVLGINAAGLLTNAVLDTLWIFGYGGFPEWGMAGAGWATVVGMWVCAAVALALFLRPRYRAEFATGHGWRLDVPLFWRLLRFGVPSGLQVTFDLLAFTVFIFFIGKMGEIELAATNIAFNINMVAVIPMIGMGQGVAVLVGQRLGENRPSLAERSTWTALKLTVVYMLIISFLYLVTPDLLLACFKTRAEGELAKWGSIAALVPVLLRFVAVYTGFDSMNIVFSFALRGAGDTFFVTCVALGMVWPIMVLPTIAAYEFGWSLYWPWTFCSAYVIGLAFIFLFRFRHGKWKSMRVIEAAPAESTPRANDDDRMILESDVPTIVNGNEDAPLGDNFASEAGTGGVS